MARPAPAPAPFAQSPAHSPSSSLVSQPPCRFFLQGTCTRGSSCPFSHDTDAPLTSEAASHNGTNSTNSTNSNHNNAHSATADNRKICTFYLRGDYHCSFGDRCKYLHVRPEHDAAANAGYTVPTVPKPDIDIDIDLPADPFDTNGISEALEATALSADGTNDEAEISVCGTYYSTGQCHDEQCPLRHDYHLCKVCENYALHPTDSDAAWQHVEECTARHNRIELRARSQHVECGICLERVMDNNRKFGLLTCDHAFCLQCIRNWRSNTGGGADVDTALRTCPVCRTTTYFIVPSAVWPTSAEQKEEIIAGYKAKLASIDCRFFNFGEGQCPFAQSCFYRHAYRDGTLEDSRPRTVAVDEDEVKVVQPVKLCDWIGSKLEKHEQNQRRRGR